MKTRIVLISKKKALAIILLIFLLIVFLYSIKQITINTMNIYDPVYKGKGDQNEIAFACNVVWGNEYISDMLDILKQHNIKISYFIGGQWASKYPELLTEIYKEGHELGNHGYMHLRHSQLSSEDNKKEILRTEAVVQKITGVKTNLFAPPYGDLNDLVVDAAEALNYRVIMWSIDTIDWNTKDYNKIIERIDKKHHNGAIILMHPTKVTIEALPNMIEKLKSYGYKITTVSEVLN
ncbi:MAG: polysaccharide deacetylase family protein [Bacillota bacterium]